MYLAENRITSATGEELFNYDLLGNRTDHDATYNLINQREEDKKYNFSYDLRGNLIEKISKDGSDKYYFTWNNQNQLTVVRKYIGSNLNSETFHNYDPQNRRIETIHSNIDLTKSYTRKMLYNGEDIIAEFDGNNNPLVFYVHGPGIDDPVAMVRDINRNGEFEARELFYFTKDHLNSIQELLDYNGNVFQRYYYSAYGETRIEKVASNEKENFIENRYGYTSRELDMETGLYYYRARWYDPEIGRFISEDPIGFSAGDTNLYRYVGGNPISRNDPSGKVAPVVIGGVVGGIVGGITSGYIASQNRCASKGDIALAALKGAGIGALTGVLATLGGLGSSVALDSSAGIWATSEGGSAVASLLGEVLGTAVTIDTGLSAGSSGGSACGCGGN